MQVVALNLDDVYPAECIGDPNSPDRFSKQLILTAFLPIAVGVGLGLGAVAWAALERMPTRMRRTRLGRRLAPRNVHPSKTLLQRAATMATPPVLFVVFCVIPSVSRALFETWACRRYRYRDGDASLDHFYLKSVHQGGQSGRLGGAIPGHHRGSSDRVRRLDEARPPSALFSHTPPKSAFAQGCV